MRLIHDIAGKRFGRPTVMGASFVPGRGRGSRAHVVVKCDCGKINILRVNQLKTGGTKSCGCLKKDVAASMTGGKNPGFRHGKLGTRLHNIWHGMLARCRNPKDAAYYRYGGRGITVHDKWLEFIPFEAWSPANGYADNLCLDRINNNGGYSPGNCHWTTHKKNNRNRRDNVIIKAFGEAKCLAEWVEDPRSTVRRNVILARINRGWPPESAITTPVTRRFPSENRND
jgi:hypothetical protein